MVCGWHFVINWIHYNCFVICVICVILWFCWFAVLEHFSSIFFLLLLFSTHSDLPHHSSGTSLWRISLCRFRFFFTRWLMKLVFVCAHARATSRKCEFFRKIQIKKSIIFPPFKISLMLTDELSLLASRWIIARHLRDHWFGTRMNRRRPKSGAASRNSDDNEDRLK